MLWFPPFYSMSEQFMKVLRVALEINYLIWTGLPPVLGPHTLSVKVYIQMTYKRRQRSIYRYLNTHPTFVQTKHCIPANMKVAWVTLVWKYAGMAFKYIKIHAHLLDKGWKNITLENLFLLIIGFKKFIIMGYNGGKTQELEAKELRCSIHLFPKPKSELLHLSPFAMDKY